MIIEVAIATVGAVTIVGTWLGLRFAEREMGCAPNATEEETAYAMRDVEHCMKTNQRDSMRALLSVRPHHLPAEVRERAQAWLDTATDRTS